MRHLQCPLLFVPVTAIRLYRGRIPVWQGRYLMCNPENVVRLRNAGGMRIVKEVANASRGAVKMLKLSNARGMKIAKVTVNALREAAKMFKQPNAAAMTIVKARWFAGMRIV